MSRKTKAGAGPDIGVPAGDGDGGERQAVGARTRRMRLRVAWMYFVEEMTQNEIAQHLGIGRVTVVRLLADARERHEIRFTIQGGLSECVSLERALEARFGLREAVVVPVSGPQADPTEAISAATGMHLSGVLRPGMKIGVGWGRTLHGTLRYIDETPLADLSVVSLMGGITKARRFNPAEFAWRLSSLVQAECYLMTAPAIVDSEQTRRTLVERCGLGEVFERAKSLDAVLISVGHLAPDGTAYRDGLVSESLRRSVIAHGAVGETLFHFFDATGRLIDHPLHDSVMSIPVGTLSQVPMRIVASGGPAKAEALLGALRLVRPTVLVTDEACAARVLALDRPD